MAAPKVDFAGLHARDMSWPGFRTWSGQRILDALEKGETLANEPIAGDVVLKCPWQASTLQAFIQANQGSLEDHQRCWSHVILCLGNGIAADVQSTRSPVIKRQSLADLLREDLKAHYRFRRLKQPATADQAQKLDDYAMELALGGATYNFGAALRPLSGALGVQPFKVNPKCQDCSEFVALCLSKKVGRYPFTNGNALAPSPAAYGVSELFHDYDILSSIA